MAMNNFKTPGQLIESILNERGWSKRILAIVIGVDETGLNKIIAGKRPLNAALALTIGELLGVEPERLLELQKSYDLAQARIVAVPDPGRQKRATLYGDLPISDMIKRGWLNAESVRDVQAVENSLIDFFEADSLDDIEILPHAAKKTEVFGGVNPSQLAWLYRVRQIASDFYVGRYSKKALQLAIPKLNALLTAPEETRKVPRILAECGIRYVVVETIPGAKIDGVCFWLNNEAPVVGMSLRYDRMDNFWFVLRHELEHVLQEHGREKSNAMLDAELEGEKAGTGANIAEEERVANEASLNFCVPQEKLEGFIARKSPFFAERDILGFARSIKVHPCLIAGQIQHRTKRYDRFRNHLVKIRSKVAPSALVDGWGDVAPVGN